MKWNEELTAYSLSERICAVIKGFDYIHFG